MTPTISDADFLWKLLAGLSLLLNFGAAVALFWSRMSGHSESREIKNDPLNVREADRFVTEKELVPLVARVDGHDEDIGAIRREATANYNAIMTSEARGRSELHREINAVATDVAAVKAIVKSLEGLPERLSRDIGILFGIQQKK